MKITPTVGFAFATFIAFATSAGATSIKDIAGTWVNLDADTRGLTRLEVRLTNDTVRLRLWGKCTPNDCDWGAIRGVAYSPSVGSDPVASTEAISATYKKGFAQTLVLVHPAADGTLAVETLTQFTDDSGRASYRGAYTFGRVGATSSPNLPQATLECPQEGGPERRILAGGVVELRYPDRVERRGPMGDVEIRYNDGRTGGMIPNQLPTLQLPVPPPDSPLSVWLARHGDSLVTIVHKFAASEQDWQAWERYESSLSTPYSKIDARTSAILRLAQ